MLIIHGHNRVFHTVSGNLSRYGAFVLPRIRIKRAINQAVAFFEHSNALDARSAETIDELRLSPHIFLERMLRLRDFKPHGQQILMQVEAIRQTEGGRLCLSLDGLAASDIDRCCSVCQYTLVVPYFVGS